MKQNFAVAGRNSNPMRLLKSCDVTIWWEKTSYVSNQLFGMKIKAAKDNAKKTLEEQGWMIEVSNLYAMTLVRVSPKP